VDRASKIAKARELRAQNITCREISERLGVSRHDAWASTWDVEIPRECGGCGADLTNTHAKRKWCSDRCRKDTLYAGECIDCGGATDGVKSGKRRPAERCRECAESVHAERNELLMEMWEADEPTWYIAEKLGMSEGSVTAWVATTRKRHGVDLGLRRLGGDAKERERRHRWMIWLRRGGQSNAEIAATVGMASAAAVSQAFVGMRRKGWKVPPAPSSGSRAGLPGAAASEIARLREEGLSNAEIAARLGYSNPGSLSNRIAELRRQGHSIPTNKRGRQPKALAA
jgi:transposase